MVDGADQPGLLGDGDEHGGRDQALLRVLPAHQRLEPADAALAQVVDRLVVHAQLPLLNAWRNAVTSSTRWRAWLVSS